MDTTFTSPSHLKLGIVTKKWTQIRVPSFFNMLSFPSTGACTRASVSKTDSSFSRNSVLARALQDIHTPVDSEAVSRERLIALFGRIQTLITKEQSGIVSRNETSSQLSTYDSFVEALDLEFLQQSCSTLVNSDLREQSTQSPKERNTKKEKKVPDSKHSTNNKVWRPPSTFVKKSPIPSPTPLQSNGNKEADTEVSSSKAPIESEHFEKMKLSELKGLAKDKGIRGYSKLKKSELIELLRLKVHL